MTELIDPRTFLLVANLLGMFLKAGDALLKVHAASAASADAALLTLAEAVHIHDGPAVPNPPVVRHVVGRPGRAA